MDTTIIYGKNAIIEALEQGKREFNKILISDNSRADIKIEQIKKLAKQNGIVFQFVTKEKLNSFEPSGKHQGVIGLIAPIKYVELDDFIETNRGKRTGVVILDGVEDSHNVGAIIRSCVCAGIKGIILPSRRGMLINSTVEKTSAGAINYISIIKTNSLVSAVQKLKENDYWVIASDHHAEQNHYEVDYTDMNFALIMGAEHTGISKSLLKLSDFKVKIPMLTNFNSLNVSNATAIILFEYVSQLSKKTRGKENG
jgi:23S rRNA (guanosine2251-2'-O)-methyltransferase